MYIKGVLMNGSKLIFSENKFIMTNINYEIIEDKMLWKMCHQNFIENESYLEIICSIFAKYKLHKKDYNFDYKGKILEFDISSSMYDCLAYEETNGFYDECDCPPPEFWIAYIDGKILSYIPESFIETADLGVEISMSDSLRWLSTINN